MLTRLLLAALLFVIPATGNSQAMHHASHGVMYHAPQWSRDGKSILVSGTPDGNSEIYLFPVSGGKPTRLTHNQFSDDTPHWLYGDSAIAFDSDRDGQVRGYRMKRDGTQLMRYQRDSVYSRSPDGNTLLFEQLAGNGGAIYAMGRDRKTARRPTGAYHAEQGSFSPDGKQIVFERRDSAHSDMVPFSDIVLMKPDGTNARRIATGTDPSWSPDGRSILFKVPDPDGDHLSIATINPDGSGLEKLAPGVHPQWSPDGTRIVFMQDGPGGRTDIWTMNADGGGKTCVTCSTEATR